MGIVDGKVVIVTGAGSGIGRAIAQAMAAEGAKVVVNDLGVSVDGQGGSSGPGDETVSLIAEAGGEAVLSTASVADPEQATSIIDLAVSTYGSIDAVVNNAGILRDAIFHKMDPRDWDSVINVHLNGSFYVSRAAATHFREQGHGAFVHMTSGSGLSGNVGQANYGAAKAGIVGLSKSIALDMARYGVRSNCIAPVAWGRMTGSIPTETPEQEALVAKLKQATPEKNAPLAVFLASDHAKHVSGQIFGVRLNEIYLFNQSRILRSVHSDTGWTPESVGATAIPALQDSFLSLESSQQLISWEPI